MRAPWLLALAILASACGSSPVAPAAALTPTTTSTTTSTTTTTIPPDPPPPSLGDPFLRSPVACPAQPPGNRWRGVHTGLSAPRGAGQTVFLAATVARLGNPSSIKAGVWMVGASWRVNSRLKLEILAADGSEIAAGQSLYAPGDNPMKLCWTGAAGTDYRVRLTAVDQDGVSGLELLVWFPL